MERFVAVEPGIQLWVEELGDPAGEPLLLIMGANASGLTWPQPLVTALGSRYRVIRYDHRDTGRSSWAFDTHPYPITRLAEDAVAVLDTLDIPRAHVAGMSLGGTLLQVLLLDHPDRLITATVWSTSALSAWAPGGETHTDTGALPGPDPSAARALAALGRPERPENRDRLAGRALAAAAGQRPVRRRRVPPVGGAGDRAQRAA